MLFHFLLERTLLIPVVLTGASQWWSGNQVLVVPEWIRGVSWLEQTVNVAVTRRQIKTAPAYDAALLLERTDEEALVKQYGNPGYRGQPP